MDHARPLDIVLHRDSMPGDADEDNGRTPADIEFGLRDPLTRVIRDTSSLELESIETIEF